MTELSEATIRRISVSQMDNNVYLITSRRTGAAILIDAADDADAIMALLDDAAASPDLVVTTHSHWDHVRALADVVRLTGARTAAGAADVSDIDVPTDQALNHGDVIDLDGLRLEVIALRGHTPGSIALLYRDPEGPAHLFTGDSLFPGGVGNTQKDPQRFASLYRDVVERIFDVLPDNTVVHPGHGKGTTLGAERPHLPEWEARGW